MTVLDGFFIGIGIIGAGLVFIGCVLAGFIIAFIIATIIKGFIEGIAIGWKRHRLQREIKSKELKRDEKRRVDDLAMRKEEMRKH